MNKVFATCKRLRFSSRGLPHVKNETANGRRLTRNATHIFMRYNTTSAADDCTHTQKPKSNSSPGLFAYTAPSSGETQIHQSNGHRRLSRFVSTLNPALLTSEQFTDISNSKQMSFRSHHGKFLLYNANNVPFPSNTHGFLYYHTPSFPVPPIAGEVRFRITASSDPSSFHSGSDALLSNGATWCTNLRQIATYERLTPLRDLLLHDGLSADVLQAAKKAANLVPTSSLVLHHLNQDFTLQYDLSQRCLWFLTDKGSGRNMFHDITRDLRYQTQLSPKNTRVHPYTGVVVVRFERSSFPQHAHMRAVVLRIVKLLSPVRCTIPDYDGFIPPPKEGDFVRRALHRTSEASVIHWDVDKPTYRMLKVLWEADEDVKQKGNATLP